MPHRVRTVASPVGPLHLVAGPDGLAAILWDNDRPGRVRLPPTVPDDGTDPVLAATETQLAAYFAGRLTRFTLPLDPSGTTFQHSVWAELRAIPYGKTRTYAEIARRIGHPTAARAVGAANGRNPISIVVPCHRVIGTAGTLTGFAGGLPAKQHLLALERTRTA